jgi:hypothetical protein
MDLFLYLKIGPSLPGRKKYQAVSSGGKYEIGDENKGEVQK